MSASVTHLDQYRLRRKARPEDDNVAVCMHCGDEYPWGRRFDHRCEGLSREGHPSRQ